MSNAFIPGEALRRRFADALGRTGWGGLNGVGQAACKAAYRFGAPWLDALKDYLRGNVATTITARLSAVRIILLL